MIKRKFFVAAACASAFGTLTSCEYMPGTEAYRVAYAQQSAAELLIDPSSAMFQNVDYRSDYVCGEINGKNRMGGFVGYKRFFVRLAEDAAQIEPSFEMMDLIEAEESCRSQSASTYATISSRASTCTRAEEQRRAFVAQAAFENTWSKHCKPLSQSSVYRPPLTDPFSYVQPEEPDGEDVSATENQVVAEPETESNLPLDNIVEGDVVAPLVDADGNPINVSDDTNDFEGE